MVSGLFSLSLCLYALDLALIFRLKEISNTGTDVRDPDLRILLDWLRRVGPEELFGITLGYAVLLIFARFFSVIYVLLLPIQLFSLLFNMFLNSRFSGR